MDTVGELIGLYEKSRGGRPDARVVYFHGLTRNFVRNYHGVPLASIDGEMTLERFRSAQCNGLRFEAFQSGNSTRRYTLMVSRDGERLKFE